MLIATDVLTGFTKTLLAAMGSSPAEAGIVAAHLVEANLKGHDSHGVGMIPEYWRSLAAGALVTNQHATVAKDSGAIRVYDGGKGYGQVIASEATDWAISKVATDGVAIFALRNTHHVGRVGTYGEQAAKAGLASIHFVNVLTRGARTAPYGGRVGRFGTDPICITFPGMGASPPVVLDFATSFVAAGKIRMAYNKGEKIPAGAYVDDDGKETTDPAVFIRDHKGAMLSFGRHKASGLALACQLLAGALTGSGAVMERTLGKPGVRNGMLSIFFDPAAFVDLAWLKTEVDELLAWVKSSPPLPGTETVLIAGEPERLTMAARLREGIDIDNHSWGELKQTAEAAGVPAGTVEAVVRQAA